LVSADVHKSAQKRSCGNNDGTSEILDIQCGLDAVRFSSFEQNLGGLSLPHIQVRLPLTNPFQSELISLLVTLGPGSPDGWTLLCVQHPKLKPRHVSHLPHFSPERINLSGQMTLCQTSDRGIAGHLPYCVEVRSNQ
jgi:hypothetical protein